jgi:hypothetical protein
MIDSFQSLGVRLSKTLKEAKTLRNQLVKNFLMTQAQINAHRLGVITLFMLFYVSPLFAMDTPFQSLGDDNKPPMSLKKIKPHIGDPDFGKSFTDELAPPPPKPVANNDSKKQDTTCSFWEWCCQLCKGSEESKK